MALLVVTALLLLQVAVGLPAMALLHLVAHSLYKAHAFLSAGGVVQRQQALRLAPQTRSGTRAWLLAALTVPAAVVGAGVASGLLDSPAGWLAGAVLGAALVPLVAAGRTLAAGAAALGWLAGHAAAKALLTPASFAVPVPVVVAVAAALLLLFVLQAAVVLRPGAAAVRRLHPWAYGGFYVDPIVSRWLLARWPLAAAPAAATPAPASSTLAGAAR